MRLCYWRQIASPSKRQASLVFLKSACFQGNVLEGNCSGLSKRKFYTRYIMGGTEDIDTLRASVKEQVLTNESLY